VVLLSAGGIASGQEQNPSPDGTLTAQQAAAVAEDASAAIVTAPETQLIDMQQIAPRLESDSDGDYVLRGSLADAQIPATAGGAFSVEGGTLQVSPVDAAGDLAGTVVGDATVVFPNTATDTDTFLRAAGAGLETVTQIRSAESPEQISWRLQLDPGQQLLQTPDGGVSVVEDTDAESAEDAAGAAQSDDAVDEFEDTASSPDDQIDGAQQAFEVANDQAPKSVVALISAPLAFDATGAAVPATLSVEDDVVTMTVQHRNSDVAYPVEADPYWTGTNVYPGFDQSFPVTKTKAAIDDLKSRGFNHVVIVPQLFTEQATDNQILWVDGRATCAETAQGDTDSVAKAYNEGVQTVINYADSKGMEVALKPHVDVVNFGAGGAAHPTGKSRTKIDAANRGGWWDSYSCKIRKYANYTHLDKIVIGTELTMMTDDFADSERAKDLITSIRGDVPASRAIGYATNWDSTVPKQMGNLSNYFFKKLDFIGVDAYYRGIWDSYMGLNGFGPQDAVADGKGADYIVGQWGAVARPTSGQCAPVSAAIPRAEYSGENIASPGLAIECLNDTYSTPGTNDMSVVLSELGYESGTVRAGFEGAYRFWNSWATQYSDRCGWFKGIWPWASSTSDGTDTYALTDADLDEIQSRNGSC